LGSRTPGLQARGKGKKEGRGRRKGLLRKQRNTFSRMGKANGVGAFKEKGENQHSWKTGSESLSENKCVFSRKKRA